jgi:hypothetical protein
MPKAQKGSKKHIQNYVSESPEELSALLLSASPSLLVASTGPIDWVSPLAKDGYKEHNDREFLRRVDLDGSWEKLSAFWPKGGPTWDAIAKVETGRGKGAILVEAKSHPRETPNPNRSRAKAPESIAKIEAAFSSARTFLHVTPDAPPWRTAHYQICNRLAHLYFMNKILRVPTWLVWLFIEHDPDWKDSASAEQWLNYLNNIYRAIGLPAEHPLKDRIITIILPPSEPGVR